MSITLRNLQIANAVLILVSLTIVLWPNNSWQWVLAVSVILNIVIAIVRIIRFVQMKRLHAGDGQPQDG